MKTLKGILAIGFLVSVALPTQAGWNFKSLRNLQVNIDYSGYSYRNASGDPVFHIGNHLRYRITIYNNSKRPFKNFPLESTMYWAGLVTCKRTWYDNRTVTFGPLATLPGVSSSGTRYVDIPPNGSAFYDVSYVVPPEICPNSGEVRLDAGRGGGKDSLRIPLRFEFRR